MEVMGSGGKPTVYPSGRQRRDTLKQLIARIDSRELERMAERYGIEIPFRPEWFTTEIFMPQCIIEHEHDHDHDFDPTVERWLNETGRTMILRQIRETRFSYWKGWADLLIPILALLVAALALFKDIIVEVLRK